MAEQGSPKGFIGLKQATDIAHQDNPKMNKNTTK